ncbi:MAG: DUF342 domain-containing protein [Spirochaetota bacterium]
MSERRDRFIDNLIREVDDILGQLQETSTGAPAGSGEPGPGTPGGAPALEAVEEPDRDGYVDIRVSKDDMRARADFYPPVGNGEPLSREAVEEALREERVVSGLGWGRIDQALSRCNNDRVPQMDVVAARGIQPVDEIPEHLEIEERLLAGPPAPPPGDKQQRVDYRELVSYVLVEEGETLARVVPRRDGQYGKTVRGELIPYQKSRAAPLEARKNTRREGDRIVASCHGRFTLWKNLFWVNEVFEIFTDVDYKTGNIHFPGDVIIHGRVKDGFKVEAGGTIHCKGTLDASEVVCKGDLLVDRGIIGRRKGVVRAGGRVFTKFIENSLVEAGDSLHVETGILHSEIHTRNKLVMGKRSIIVGGRLHAFAGVDAAQLGNDIGIKTEVICGVDSTVQRKIEWIKEKTLLLAEKARQLEQRIHKGLRNPEAVQMLEKLRGAVRSLNQKNAALLAGQRSNWEARVTVSANVYPGVYLEICNLSLVVPRQMKGVVFRPDPETRKIQTDPLL